MTERCDYADMDWWCEREAGHEGAHRKTVAAHEPVLFLDVDGVLNSEGYWRINARRDGLVIDPAAVARILGLVERTGAKIVLSSSWRHYPDGMEALNAVGITWIDVTPTVGTPRYTSANRGSEIRHWLDEHPDVTKYAIVDDDGDAGENGLAASFVQTSWLDGLLDEHCVRLEALLR